VRPNKANSLRDRLRRGADAFEFDALIEGVSTLDEPAANPAAVVEAPLPGPAEVPTASTSSPPDATEAPGVAAAPLPLGQNEARTASRPPRPEPRRQSTLYGSPTTMAGMFQADSLEHGRLETALEALGAHLLQEAGRMGAAMQTGDATSAGFHLARVNQLLELLRTVDPRGDVARRLKTSAAPPGDRTWPSTTWSVAEFASSPLSGLLPHNAGEPFVREMMWSAWGMAGSTPG
jgi:hypothetical protein